MAEGKRASLKWDVPASLWGVPFSACGLPQEAPAPVLTHSCWLLFAIAVKSIPGEGWDKPCQRIRKAGSVAVGLTNVRMFTVPVGTLISLFTLPREPHVKRKSSEFRYYGREWSFETQVISIAWFYFAKTEIPWAGLGGTQPFALLELLTRELNGTFSREEKDS